MMDIQVSITSKTQSVQEYHRFAQVKNHVQMYGVNILDYPDTKVPASVNGIPSVRQLIQTAQQKPVTLSRDLQEWMFGLMLDAAPDGMSRADVVKCWANAYMGSKAFTNRTGWDTVDEETGKLTYADYIQGTGLENSEGFKLQPCICHGATVKVMRDPFFKAGVWQCEIEIADAFDPFTLSLNYENAPHLIFPAINWTRYPLPYGQADPFPKLGGRDVLIPLLGNHTTVGYIELDWLRFIEPGEQLPANPYWREET
jgi:hypothetical protein